MKARKKSIQHLLIVWLLRLALLLYIGAIAYLCFGNFHNIQHIQRFILGIPTDKAVHFCMFFPLPIIAFLAYDKATNSPLQAFAAIICVCSFSCIYAGLTEIIQGMIPYRSQDVNDFAFDCMAIVLSSLIVFIVDVAKMKKPKNKRK